MPAVLVVTTEGVPGYQITSVIGQVVGSIARLSNAFTEGIRTMDGQLNPRRGQDLAQWRTDAVNAMVEEARKQGANAVIGMRFDNRGISTAWAEICAYGTAVRVDPHDRPPEGPPAGQPAPVQPPRAEEPVVPPPKAQPAPPEEPAPPEAEVEAEEVVAEEEANGEVEAGKVEAGEVEAVVEEAEVEPSATGWPDAADMVDESGEPAGGELVGPERLRPEDPDPDWPDSPTDPTLRIPD